jgi:hypothetical protein
MSITPDNRTVGQTISETSENHHGSVFFVEVVNAMTPVHAKAVQALASCVRKHVPSMHESRSTCKELGSDEDPGLGGDNFAHLAPLVGCRMERALDKTGSSRVLGRGQHPEPKDLGFRASEHLTCTNFPSLDRHEDGMHTACTCDFALSHPEDCEGGHPCVIDKAEKRAQLKPSKHSASAFLGGTCCHGATETLGGHREMFSSESGSIRTCPLEPIYGAAQRATWKIMFPNVMQWDRLLAKHAMSPFF